MSWITLLYALAAPVHVPVAGHLSDTAGAPLTGSHTLDLKLFDAASGGAAFHEEAFTAAFDDGAFSVILGAGGALQDSALFGRTTAWLEVSFDGGAASARVPVGASPFAVSAQSAAALGGVEAGAFYREGDADRIPWSALNAASIPEGARNGYTAGAGLTLTGGAFALDATDVTARAKAAAYDTVAELRAALDGVYYAPSGGGLGLADLPLTDLDARYARVSAGVGPTTVANNGTLDVVHNMATFDVVAQIWRTFDNGASYEQANPSGASPASVGAYGSGQDGALFVSGNTDYRIDAVRATLNGSGVAGTIAGGTGSFAVGDLALLIQMQGANAGRYEEATIAAVSGTSLTFAATLTNTYATGSGNAAQILKIPRYASVSVADGSSIRPTPWDGSTGGIVAFKVAGTLTLNSTGKIDASARGFRGGITGGSSDTPSQARPFTGESYTGPSVVGIVANGGGGSAGIAGNDEGMSGGFGGSYGAVGTTGVTACVSCGGPIKGQIGAVYGVDTLAQIFPGSGGGGGSNAYWTSLNPQVFQPNGFGGGGAGGGIVYVFAHAVSGGQILADGAQGQPGYLRANTSSDISGGPGGGGSGGSVYLMSPSASTTAFARGGAAVNATATAYGNWTNAPHGGAGGAGRVRFDGLGTVTATPVAYAGAATSAAAAGLALTQVSNNVVRMTNRSGGPVTVRVTVKR
jgi:hypothetical protein